MGEERRGEKPGVGGQGAPSVSREEVSCRGERGQTPRDIGQEGEVGETLDVGLQLLPHLGHPRQLLLVLLQGAE